MSNYLARKLSHSPRDNNSTRSSASNRSHPVQNNLTQNNMNEPAPALLEHNPNLQTVSQSSHSGNFEANLSNGGGPSNSMMMEQNLQNQNHQHNNRHDHPNMPMSNPMSPNVNLNQSQNTTDMNDHDHLIDDDDEEHKKIFVGGLSWQTTTESLTHYFQKFGEIQEGMVMKDPQTNRSRGFGFITFKDPKIVDDVIKFGKHEIDEKLVDPKVAFPKRGQPRLVTKTRKIFVGGLASNTVKEDLENYFSEFGEVDEAMLMFDRQTNRHRGFGFVNFVDEKTVDKICEIQFHEINGKKVECKKAQPKEIMMPRLQNALKARAVQFTGYLSGPSTIGLSPATIHQPFPIHPNLGAFTAHPNNLNGPNAHGSNLNNNSSNQNSGINNLSLNSSLNSQQFINNHAYAIPSIGSNFAVPAYYQISNPSQNNAGNANNGTGNNLTNLGTNNAQINQQMNLAPAQLSIPTIQGLQHQFLPAYQPLYYAHHTTPIPILPAPVIATSAENINNGQSFTANGQVNVQNLPNGLDNKAESKPDTNNKIPNEKIPPTNNNSSDMIATNLKTNPASNIQVDNLNSQVKASNNGNAVSSGISGRNIEAAVFQPQQPQNGNTAFNYVAPAGLNNSNNNRFINKNNGSE